jgi:hypothetical protein
MVFIQRVLCKQLLFKHLKSLSDITGLGDIRQLYAEATDKTRTLFHRAASGVNQQISVQKTHQLSGDVLKCLSPENLIGLE